MKQLLAGTRWKPVLLVDGLTQCRGIVEQDEFHARRNPIDFPPLVYTYVCMYIYVQWLTKVSELLVTAVLRIVENIWKFISYILIQMWLETKFESLYFWFRVIRQDVHWERILQLLYGFKFYKFDHSNRMIYLYYRNIFIYTFVINYRYIMYIYILVLNVS